jgi:hypothetical protein
VTPFRHLDSNQDKFRYLDSNQDNKSQSLAGCQLPNTGQKATDRHAWCGLCLYVHDTGWSSAALRGEPPMMAETQPSILWYSTRLRRTSILRQPW